MHIKVINNRLPSYGQYFTVDEVDGNKIYTKEGKIFLKEEIKLFSHEEEEEPLLSENIPNTLPAEMSKASSMENDYDVNDQIISGTDVAIYFDEEKQNNIKNFKLRTHPLRKKQYILDLSCICFGTSIAEYDFPKTISFKHFQQEDAFLTLEVLHHNFSLSGSVDDIVILENYMVVCTLK